MKDTVPGSFSELIAQWDEVKDDLLYVRQLKNLEIVTNGGDMRRIVRAPGGVNAILNLGNQPSVIPSGPLIGAQPTYDPETLRWINRALGAGGTFGANSKQIADAFIVALHAKPYNDKIIWLNPLLGGNLATALVPLRDKLSVGAAVNHNFLENDFSEVAGMTSNGTTKWLDLLFKPSELGAPSSRNGGFGLVIAGSPPAAAGTPWIIGMTNSSTQIFGLNLNTAIELFYWGDGNSATQTGSPAGPFHYYGQRASSTDRRLYKNGNLVASDVDGGVIDNAVGFATANLFTVDAGLGVAAATVRVAYATDGTMTPDDVADFNALVNSKLVATRSSDPAGTTISAPTSSNPSNTTIDLIVIADDEVICADDEIVTMEA